MPPIVRHMAAPAFFRLGNLLAGPLIMPALYAAPEFFVLVRQRSLMALAALSLLTGRMAVALDSPCLNAVAGATFFAEQSFMRLQMAARAAKIRMQESMIHFCGLCSALMLGMAFKALLAGAVKPDLGL